jgi:HAD superfamily hydrolase (TIGR01490 family)
VKVALFDLDHTLIEGDSDVLWMQRAAARGLGDMGPMESFFADYEAGTLDIEAYYAYTFGVFAGKTMADFEDELGSFLAEDLLPILRPAPLARLRAEQEAGAITALVTATGELVARGIAQALGFDALLATRLGRTAGRLDGSILGSPCFRRGKIEHVEAWLARRGTRLDELEDSSFYGDSRNDLFIMEQVRRPVAVGPDSTLRALSEERSWDVIEIR